MTYKKEKLLYLKEMHILARNVPQRSFIFPIFLEVQGQRRVDPQIPGRLPRGEEEGVRGEKEQKEQKQEQGRETR